MGGGAVVMSGGCRAGRISLPAPLPPPPPLPPSLTHLWGEGAPPHLCGANVVGEPVEEGVGNQLGKEEGESVDWCQAGRGGGGQGGRGCVGGEWWRRWVGGACEWGAGAGGGGRAARRPPPRMPTRPPPAAHTPMHTPARPPAHPPPPGWPMRRGRRHQRALPHHPRRQARRCAQSGGSPPAAAQPLTRPQSHWGGGEVCVCVGGGEYSEYSW